MEEREKLPNRKLIGRKQDGEKVEEWEKLPNRKLIGSKRVGEKIEEREKLPNRKLIGSKQDGEKVECTCQQILDTKYKKIFSYIVRLYTPYATLDIAPRNSGQIIPTV